MVGKDHVALSKFQHQTRTDKIPLGTKNTSSWVIKCNQLSTFSEVKQVHKSTEHAYVGELASNYGKLEIERKNQSSLISISRV